jgi:hypothetical protein
MIVVQSNQNCALIVAAAVDSSGTMEDSNQREDTLALDTEREVVIATNNCRFVGKQ